MVVRFGVLVRKKKSSTFVEHLTNTDMKTHFYISVYTPGNKNDLLTYCLDSEAEDRLNKLVDETDLTNSDLISMMWEYRKDAPQLCKASSGYVVGTKTFRAAKEVFGEEQGKPFVVCLKLTKGKGQGHVQMCGAAIIRDDKMENVIKMSKIHFEQFGKMELSTI